MDNTKKVFFIGDVALDEYYSAPYFPKIRDKVLLQTLPAQMGGSIANAACVYTSFGTSASFLTALNSGPLSQKLCSCLNENGIDTAYMVWDDTLPDSKCIIILAENEHTVLIPTLNLQKMEISDKAFNALCRSDYLYSTFCELRPLYYKGMPAKEVLSKIIQSGCRLWCDLDVAEVRDGDEFFFELIDTMFINETGYDRLNKFTGNEPVNWMLSKGINNVIVTKAEQGCSVYSKGIDTITIPGIHVSVVDVTGAGDTFCSAFLFAHTKGLEIRLCAEFANAAAAQAVTKIGARAGAVGITKVFEFMSEHHINTENFKCIT